MYTVASTSNDGYAPDHIVLSGSRRLPLFRTTFDAPRAFRSHHPAGTWPWSAQRG